MSKEARYFSLLENVLVFSCIMGTGIFFPEIKAAGTLIWPLISI
jgi:hypothetical protein